LEVKYGKVRLIRPEQIAGGASKYPSELEINIIEVKEKEETIPVGEKGIEWRLYTSHEVENREDAEKIIGYYKKRWIIEDVFRTLKTEGVRYEDSGERERGSAEEAVRNGIHGSGSGTNNAIEAGTKWRDRTKEFTGIFRGTNRVHGGFTA
jgi:hypothetical protein